MRIKIFSLIFVIFFLLTLGVLAQDQQEDTTDVDSIGETQIPPTEAIEASPADETIDTSEGESTQPVEEEVVDGEIRQDESGIIYREYRVKNAIIMVLDTSGSMQSFFHVVQDVLKESLINEMLSAGDYFLLVTFGNDAKAIYSGQILREEDKNIINGNIDNMQANQMRTDIGRALKLAIAEQNNIKELPQEFNTVVLFITDGRQDAVRESEFYEMSIEEIIESLDLTSSLVETFGNWYIISIGTETDAAALARAIGREEALINIDQEALREELELTLETVKEEIYVPPPTPPTPEPELIGKLIISSVTNSLDKMVSINHVEPVAPKERITWNITLKSTWEDESKQVTITQSRFVLNSASASQPLEIPLMVSQENKSFEMGPNATKVIPISFTIPEQIKWKDPFTGILSITFTYNEDVAIETFEQQMELQEWYMVYWERYTYYIIGGAAALLLLLLLILYLILKALFKKDIFQMQVTETDSPYVQTTKLRKTGSANFGSKKNLDFQLKESFPNIVGTFERDKKHFSITKTAKDSFAEDQDFSDYKLGTSISLKDENGKIIKITFNRIK